MRMEKLLYVNAPIVQLALQLLGWLNQWEWDGSVS